MSSWLKRNERRLSKARRLLRPALSDLIARDNGLPNKLVWADLGCGEGIFTYLLYEAMPHSNLHAIDKNRGALRRLENTMADLAPDADLEIHQADFTKALDLPTLDGLLLANSLHFVRDKLPLLKQLKAYLKPGGRLVLVEYNTNRGNTWVPYPLDEHTFTQLARETGYQTIKIVAHQPSSFLGEMFTGIGFTV